MDRSKFKGNSFNQIDKEKERAEQALPKGGNSDGRAGFHKIEDGRNYRRIAPAHNADEPAYRAKSTVFLECEVPEIDDNGKETGKVEVKNKPIFIATQHSELGADPILMYIEAVNRRANDEFSNKDDRQKFLYPINGWRGKDGKWNWGIRPDIKFVCYAWDEKGVLGREELFPQWLDEMKRISVQRSEDNAEIIPDIFTDPDEGYPLLITKEKNEKGKYEYHISCDMPSASKKESWADFFDRVKVTDDQLAELIGKESLKQLYWDVYTTRDFDMAVSGLRLFDKKHNFHIFDNEEFLEALSDLRLKVKPYQPKSNNAEEPVKESSPTREQVSKNLGVKVTEDSTPTTNIVPIPKMKTVIKQYILENYGDDYSLPENLTKEQIKQWYDLAVAGEELPFDANNEQIPDNTPTHEPEKFVQSESNVAGVLKKDPEPDVESKPSGLDPALQAKIDMLKNKRKNLNP